MKKFLYYIMIPAIVLGIVYHYGYNSGRSDGVRSVSVPAPIHAASSSVPPASITGQPPKTQPVVKRFIETPEGLVVEGRPVRTSPITSKAGNSDKAVFRTPNVSGNQPIHVPVSVKGSDLQPLQLPKPTPDVPVIAKPSDAPKDNDCGCKK